MRRLLPLVTSVLVGLLVLAGCGTGPDRTGAAAVVGTTVIPISEIQDNLRTAVPDLRVAVDQQAAAAQPAHLAQPLGDVGPGGGHVVVVAAGQPSTPLSFANGSALIRIGR